MLALGLYISLKYAKTELKRLSARADLTQCKKKKKTFYSATPSGGTRDDSTVGAPNPFSYATQTRLMTERLLCKGLGCRPSASRHNFTHVNATAAIEIKTSGFPAVIISSKVAQTSNSVSEFDVCAKINYLPSHQTSP